MIKELEFPGHIANIKNKELRIITECINVV